MNLKIVHVRSFLGVLAVACVLTSAALPLAISQIAVATGPCPTGGVPVTTSLTLNSDCTYTSGSGILLGANGITLNCNGYTITGSGLEYGVKVIGYSGVTIENCKVTGAGTGFEVESSPSTRLNGNTATSDGGGFLVEYSPFTVLSGNTATGSEDGFFVNLSFNNQLSGNKATSNLDGFLVIDSVGTTLSSNTATSNSNGFYLNGITFPDTQYKLTGNKADSNGQYGYGDHTVGAGNLGLGNTYSGNECSLNGSYGSYDAYAGFGPAHLCTPQG